MTLHAPRVPHPRVVSLVVAALALLVPIARGGEALQEIEKEFKAGIDRVTAATVVCLAEEKKGEKDRRSGRSSGVIVSRRGLVLSDGDVGIVYMRAAGDKVESRHEDSVEVRVPNLRKGDFATYHATVVRRLKALDTTLLRITDGPRDGFTGWLVPASSDGVIVGDFTFVMGNSFHLSDEALPSLTAGVVASLTPFPPKEGGPRAEGGVEWLYTSAAVNPGVNGGPLVDVEGRLVATISGPVPPAEAQQFLGKAVPMDRIRAAYADLPEAAELFPAAKAVRERSKGAAALEATVHAAAMRAHPGIVSLEVKRAEEISKATPQGRPAPLRYSGPVSAVLVDREGWMVTSLYNLTSIATLETPEVLWPQHSKEGASAPAAAGVEHGLSKIESIQAHFADGRSLPAKLVGHDVRLGVALLRAEMPAATADGTSYSLPVPEAAPGETFREGRFVVAAGNPFGSVRRPAPLVTFGILSKHHERDAPRPWRGQWQTDAGATDGNVGGPVVDLRGRVVGMLTIWSPAHHGRNSGIAFVVPWDRILAALPDMKAGKTLQRGYLGILWKGDGRSEPRIKDVVPDSGAARAGLAADDVVVRVGTAPISIVFEASERLPHYWEGDTLTLTIRRGTELRDINVILGARPPTIK
jgi:S1-C subfamily serine protease